MSRVIVDQLAQQFGATLDMLRAALEKCPDALWAAPEPKPAYWHEAYHTLFWCDNFAGDRNKPFELEPFSAYHDPRLFRDPGEVLAKAELLGFVEQAREHVSERFGAMADVDLTAQDAFGEEPGEAEFDVVIHRILYGLRHGQHHVGRLSQRLRAEDIGLGSWRG